MLKNKIKNNEKLIGMYVQLADITSSKIAGLAGYDFVWVDTEHSYMSYETLLSHIISLDSTNTPVIVRAPQNDLTATKKIVEMGVDGIIFPMVKTAKEATDVISNTLYPPYGTRGFGPMNAVGYGFKNAYDYALNNHKEMCRFIQIEHKECIENLDEIMEVPFIDGFIFGPNDLALSYGLLDDVFGEKMTQIIKDAVARLKSKGKYVAIASGGWKKEIVEHWASFGVDMLVSGADFDFLRDGAIKNRESLQGLLK